MTFARILVLSCSTLVTATFASHATAAQGGYDQRHSHSSHSSPSYSTPSHGGPSHSYPSRPSSPSHSYPSRPQYTPTPSHPSISRPHSPAYTWRTGQRLPSQYRYKHYQVHPRELRHLPRSSAKEQWYKIDGHYVLVNTKNHKIQRIIR